MSILYYLVIKCYGLLILLASPFNTKAGKWVSGRANWYYNLRSALKNAGDKRIHFHCPSLGEFEQGKPVLELIRKNYPDHFIILTFFSPSGFEIRKNEKLANHICYLPLDGPLNSQRFIKLVNPEFAIFVKYDFWHFFIRSYHSHKIPLLFISSKFRASQLYFKAYGKFYRKILKRVNHFFVQDQVSLELLYEFGIPHVTVSGDTRFDKVQKNFEAASSNFIVKKFKGDKKIFIAGSTWPVDEREFNSILSSLGSGWRMIIAPHEIGTSRVRKLKEQFGDKAIKYSEWNTDDQNRQVLIIDNIGLLSSIYQYAEIAYIGGGFGKGIHNILEAAVFGIPIIIGPKFKKFKEANDLIAAGGAFSITSTSQLHDMVNNLVIDQSLYSKASQTNKEYIEKNRGASKIVLEYIKLNFEDTY